MNLVEKAREIIGLAPKPSSVASMPACPRCASPQHVKPVGSVVGARGEVQLFECRDDAWSPFQNHQATCPLTFFGVSAAGFSQRVSQVECITSDAPTLERVKEIFLASEKRLADLISDHERSRSNTRWCINPACRLFSDTTSTAFCAACGGATVITMEVKLGCPTCGKTPSPLRGGFCPADGAALENLKVKVD
jgi:hypothetical protein